MAYHIVLDYSGKTITSRKVFGDIVAARKYAIYLLKKHSDVEIAPILDPKQPKFDTFRNIGIVARDYPSWTSKYPSGYVWLPEKGGKKKLTENGTIARR